MDIGKKILEGKLDVPCDEQDIQQVIHQSKNMFVSKERERILPCHEFLLRQLQITRKRWWIFQFLLLFAAWFLIREDAESFYIRRELGIIAAIFVILIVPELWKNLSNRCLEIEMASYYSLRRIYAARLLLFGGTDLILLTIFIACSCTMLKVSLMELTTAFLLPLIITAAICFLILSLQDHRMEVVVGACAGWSIFWWLLVANDKWYNMITMQAWICVLVAAITFLIFTVYRIFISCSRLWEVNTNGIVTE